MFRFYAILGMERLQTYIYLCVVDFEENSTLTDEASIGPLARLSPKYTRFSERAPIWMASRGLSI